jgi:hypothetical protein
MFRVTELREREAAFKSRDFVVFLFVDKNSHCGKTART